MPELPEVEVVKRSLEKKMLNLIIKKVKINDGNLRYKVKKQEISKLIGLKIKKIKRRSKFLIFKTNKDLLMLIHLGMTGKFFFVNKKNKKLKTSFYYELIDEKKEQKHDRVIFFFKDKQKLIFNDIRKFGFIKFYNLEQFIKNSHFKKLGPEPLTKNWNSRYFKNFILGRNRNIKNLLMDQNFISGLGNIYVNEILHKSGIRPTRKVSTLKNYEIIKIVQNTKKTLKVAIKFGGSSIKDFSNEDGKKGTFQQYFQVYGRKGEKCSNIDCNMTITKLVISNRASFFCKACQK